MEMKRDSFDFWYAVNNTEVVLAPTRHLETFGSTVLNYFMVCELMDSVTQVRIREGRLQAHKPQIITPEAYASTLLEGFGEDAEQYVDWLRQHDQDLRILQYGYQLKQESFSEHVVTDSLEAVVERIKKDVEASEDPFTAVLTGVDSPWDVCLVKLFWEVVQGSAKSNIAEMNKHNLFSSRNGVPLGIWQEIETLFLEASRNPKLIPSLSDFLHKHHVFKEYEDRFFSLVSASKRRTGEGH